MKRLYDRLLDMNDTVFLQIVITWYLVGLGVIASLVEVIVTRNVSGLGLNLSTELIGSALIYVLLSVIVGRQLSQDAERRVKQEKDRLILQMGSPNNAFAVEAARILRARGWGFHADTTLHEANLEEANLQGARLWDANLQGVNLEGSNLEGTNLMRANLQGANLVDANLQGVRLGGANLQGANLWDANLQGAWLRIANLEEANLEEANLQDAHLVGANLRGANLWDVTLDGANLEEADLQEANLNRLDHDEKTILPDGSPWKFDVIDRERFTDPNHPDFWRSKYPYLPAYRGDDDAD